MELNEVMKAVRRMRDFQKKKSKDYTEMNAKREAERAVDRMVKEWELEEFYKHQGILF